MRSINNFNTNHEHNDDLTAFEEELLLNYEDYLNENNSYSLKLENHYDLELDDLDQEYDENDWEELEDNNEENEDL